MRIDPVVIIATLVGGISGGLAVKHPSFSTFAAAFVSAFLMSALVTRSMGKKVIFISPKPNFSNRDDNPLEEAFSQYPPELRGYIRAMRWKEPLTDEQKERVRNLFQRCPEKN